MVTIAHASLDESGKIKNGKAGDQTGKEVCIRSWYNKPWNVVIRFNDTDMREKCARAMENAANNEHIGYDQNQRNTLLNAVRRLDYDPKNVTSDVETDCSALVTVACIYAGIAEQALVVNGNCATTRTLKSRLKATGEVEIFTSKDYTQDTDRLLRGDILLSEGHHVAVVVSGNLVDNADRSLDEVAMAVIRGEYGTGSARRAKLMEEGYNYSVVQARVNELTRKHTPPVSDVPKYIWNYLYGRIQNPYGVAGLMGNLKAESNLNPKNMQNSYEKKLGFNDDTYTNAVDTGSYGKFCTDKVGYGLAQWTSDGRKKALYNSRKGRSIGDIDMQLEFLWKELTTSYRGVLNGLKVAESVREASDLVLTKFERPKDQSEAVKVKRASYGQEYYNKFFVV
jgi:hypothetical protein